MTLHTHMVDIGWQWKGSFEILKFSPFPYPFWIATFIHWYPENRYFFFFKTKLKSMSEFLKGLNNQMMMMMMKNRMILFFSTSFPVYLSEKWVTKEFIFSFEKKNKILKKNWNSRWKTNKNKLFKKNIQDYFSWRVCGKSALSFSFA